MGITFAVLSSRGKVPFVSEELIVWHRMEGKGVILLACFITVMLKSDVEELLSFFIMSLISVSVQGSRNIEFGVVCL